MGSLNDSFSQAGKSGIRKSNIPNTLKDVNMCRVDSIIETVDANGNQMATQVYVDLFVFKCWALLMCRGKFHHKA